MGRGFCPGDNLHAHLWSKRGDSHEVDPIWRGSVPLDRSVFIANDSMGTILRHMGDGCAITCARVNLGFWWGYLLHFTNDLVCLQPTVFSMV